MPQFPLHGELAGRGVRAEVWDIRSRTGKIALYMTEEIGHWIHLGQHWERAHGGLCRKK